MALKKTVSTSYGVDAEYWKIGKIDIDSHNHKSLLTMLGFVNAQARTEGKKEISTKQMRFDGENFTFDVEEPLHEQFYSKVKSLPEWEGSIDV